MLISKPVVTRIGSQTHAGAAEFDIHVLAFPAASQRTVQGLCDLFGLDAPSAQRIIASAPAILRQRVPAAEAEACAQALRKLGARVVLEPAQVKAPPPPPAAAYLQHTANWGAPARPANDGLPRPVAHGQAPAADLEYDVLSALDAALEGDQAADVPALRKLTPRMSVEQLEAPMDLLEGPGMGLKGRQEELDLGGRGSHEQAPLELDGGPTHTQRKAAPAQPRRQADPDASEREPSGKVHTQPRQPVAPAGLSRAALVERRAPEAPPSRNIPLLQLLAACAVFAVGYWADSSVLYGSAGLVSVVLHGLALQQLILGLRGLLS